nr:MAG TPA: hypothetical protein [Caudoviricetes sp.]
MVFRECKAWLLNFQSVFLLVAQSLAHFVLLLEEPSER